MAEKEQFQNVFSGLDMTSDARKEVQQIKKVSEVIASTDLKESQIGLYIKERLIHPSAAASRHFKAGYLLGGEVEQLKAVICLRIYEFGLEEIQYLAVCGEEAEAYLKKKSEEKLVLYQNKPDLLAAIAVLQKYAPEGKELAKIRKELRHYDFIPKAKDYQPSFLERYRASLILMVILGILLASFFAKIHSLPGRIMGAFAMLAVGGILAIGSGIAYLLKRKTPAGYSNKTSATIDKVVIQTGFDTSFAMGKSIVPGSGFHEQGKGGIWQFVFMFWNEIRPDHYFPIVLYRADGEERIGTFRMGGFRNTWKAGEKIDICWAREDQGLVWPLDTAYLMKKGCLALATGFLLMGVFVWKIGPVYRAANHPFAMAVRDMNDIFHGIEEVYVGSESVTDQEIRLDYELYTGAKEYTIHCEADDIIYVESDADSDYEFIRLRRGHESYPHFLSGVKTQYGYLNTSLQTSGGEERVITAYSIVTAGEYRIVTEAYRAQGSFHAWVEHGADAAAKAGAALLKLADAETMALCYVNDSGNPDAAQTTTYFYYDQGRYYRKTETKVMDETVLQEQIFDGSSGWSRSTKTGPAWEENPDAEPVPVQLVGIRANADKLINQSSHYQAFTYLDGHFMCDMTREYLDQMVADIVFQLETMLATVPAEQQDALKQQLETYQTTHYELGNIQIDVDEESGQAQSFYSFIAYTEGSGEAPRYQEMISHFVVLSDVDAAAEIDRILAER